ncbi:hypothetical protein BX661DRAFT_144364 [Kickxella alabastrina]|uniref:uncharacterized protein n=1 Tax=Kickxella alabastrina TaxID=61397 RepID=UPI0022202D1E|nr:uncharacterized protein BX661DRAFT_144364 [Kickxella alabastrina]KAI7825404.1 hypothetical protein BX661DRAFT_144364 [Kickxella alabastrina]
MLRHQLGRIAPFIAIAIAAAAAGVLASPVDTVESVPLPGEEKPIPPGESDYYIRLFACAVLVIAGGLLAGLTLGLMSLDETNLHILATSGTPQQQLYAKRIQPIRKNGHWLLVTLLLGNTVINETLPIVMDSILGGGVKAVLVSTASIVLFGEIIPQSLCARYGLAIGAFFAYPVRILQYILSPLGYPIALLLDYVLGPDHGITYKKAALKELVSLSDTAHGGNLSADEVTIIRGALELGEKLVVEVMTDLNNVYMVDINARLDRSLLTEMLRQGHSRVPVYEGERTNVVGVLLVKSLILLDPDDAVPVRETRMSDIPLVTPDISLYDILNAFQEGGSHMAVVVGPRADREGTNLRAQESTPLLGAATDDPAWPPLSPLPLVRRLHFAPIGIITLEDVIEELIQEEIIDETDVFVDMRQKIKVMRAVKLVQNLSIAPQGKSNAAYRSVTGSSAPTGDETQQEVAAAAAAKKRGVAFSSRRRRND